MSILDNINYPSDLKSLSKDSLQILCDELREYIIKELALNPGHLGSSLGVIELTVALHKVYDTPNDKLVWDVGHQSYAHKIITGRKELFKNKRKLGGISGFPKRSESEFDAFGGGHSSVSISAALGMAVAAKKQGKDQKCISVIGDGAMSGGLAFEGLNNAGIENSDILVILNDNNMSIDPNVGALHKYLLNITTTKRYNKFRSSVYNVLKPYPAFSNRIANMKSAIKRYVFKNSNLFESFGFRYFGTVNGNDITALLHILESIKDIKGPKLLHIITKKGKGYEPAETNQTTWHAPGKFNANTGEISASIKQKIKYQDVFGHTLVELAEQNDKIIGITPAMPTGCSMCVLQQKYPEKVFDVGIAEGHAVTFSGGLAVNGMLPFCNIYSSFSQRAYDNIIHDLVLQGVDAVLCLDRAGLVGEDGPTHHGCYDISFLRCVPNITIAAPRDEHELRNMMYTAQKPGKGVVVIRYPRGSGMLDDWKCEFKELEIGKGITLSEGNDIAILSLGTTANDVSAAIEELKAEGCDKSIAHIDLRFAKPLDEELILKTAQKVDRIITIEDGSIAGGVGSAVLELLSKNNISIPVKLMGIPDKFITHGKVSELKSIAEYDKTAIKNEILRIL
ncbi:MAG: 1-deoxy-D-xylulose-5-phosphate synthase [Rikenellaceae bacterium]